METVTETSTSTATSKPELDEEALKELARIYLKVEMSAELLRDLGRNDPDMWGFMVPIADAMDTIDPAGFPWWHGLFVVREIDDRDPEDTRTAVVLEPMPWVLADWFAGQEAAKFAGKLEVVEARAEDVAEGVEATKKYDNIDWKAAAKAAVAKHWGIAERGGAL